MAKQEKQEKTFNVTVDGEPVEIPRKDVTPRVILKEAKLDPAKRYLIEIKGSKRESYKNQLDEEIKVHEKQKFVTGKLGEVPVS